QAAHEQVQEQERALGERLVNVVLDDHAQAVVHVPKADHREEAHQHRVQRIGANPGDGALIVGRRQADDREDGPDGQRDQRDGAHALADPMAGAVAGGAQTAGAGERRAETGHQSAPVMAAMTQTTTVATTVKANTATALALADLMSRPAPASQNRCRTPLARWYSAEAVRPSITSLPTGEPRTPLKVA